VLGFAALAVASVALAAVWTASYVDNRGFIAAAQAKAGAAKAELEKLGAPRPGDEAQLVRALNALRELPGGYREREGGVSMSGGFGLSQREKLGAQALRAYRNALRDVLVPRLAASQDDYTKWRLSQAESAELAGHVRAAAEEAIIKDARPKQAPAKDK
jgi:type VI secretion system protein ImpL